jgi:hypothetical protein
MDVTVFYAWQADRPIKVNQALIRDAASAACARISADGSNPWQMKLDQGAEGALGMCDIPNEILKKIKKCDIFLADLTLVGKTDGGKALPNSNVTFELGFAARRHGFRVMIGVVNEAFGQIDGQIFDIKRRSSLKYTLAASASPDKIERARDRLSKKLEAIIRDTIAQHVEPKRQGTEKKLAGADKQVLESFVHSVTNFEYHGLRPQPAVVHLIKFRPPPHFVVDDAIRAVRNLGLKCDVSEHGIVWKESAEINELLDVGLLRHVSTSDLRSAQNLRKINGGSSDFNFLVSKSLQQLLVARVFADCQFLDGLGIKPPWSIGVAIVGANGYWLLDNEGNQGTRPLRGSSFLFPMARMTSASQFKDIKDVGAVLKSGLDKLCRSVGRVGSEVFK